MINFKFNRIKTKKYLLLFILLMTVNILLTATLLRSSFAQTEKDFSTQEPIKVHIMEQKNCPLQIVIVNVDNSSLYYQDIVFSLRNISNKPIKAYTLLGDGKNNGKIITSFFTAKRFLEGESVMNSFDVERQNLTDEESILLSFDYVEFEDGSFWGSDSAGKSEEISGQREGTKASIKFLKNIITKQNSGDTNNVVNFLKQDMQKIIIDLPKINQSEGWQKGFKLGYKSVISILQREEDQKIEKLAEKLAEIEKIANRGEKQ